MLCKRSRANRAKGGSAAQKTPPAQRQRELGSWWDSRRWVLPPFRHHKRKQSSNNANHPQSQAHKGANDAAAYQKEPVRTKAAKIAKLRMKRAMMFMVPLFPQQTRTMRPRMRGVSVGLTPGVTVSIFTETRAPSSTSISRGREHRASMPVCRLTNTPTPRWN